MRNTISGILLLGMVFSLGQAAAASVDIPVYPGATVLSRVEYKDPKDFPKFLTNSMAAEAVLLRYHVVNSTEPDAVADFYSKTLGKDHWDTHPVQDPNYFLYLRDGDQIIVRVKPQDNGMAVYALGLTFPRKMGGSNQAQLMLQKKVDDFAPGGTLHIVCPAGVVIVHASAVRDINFNVMARAAVDYPLVAETLLKKLQLISKASPGGVILGVDTSSIQDDGLATLAYTFNVSVPVGANVVVEINGHVNPGPDLRTADGNVNITGATGDVQITTQGPVTVANATGKVAIDTNGPVILRNLSSDIKVHSNGMWIKGDGITVNGNIDLETSESRVDLRLAAVQDGSLKCVTSNAPISLSVPPDASVDITASGAEECVAPVPFSCVLGVTGMPGPKRWHAVMNGGKVPLDLQTSAGDIGGARVYIQNK